MLGPRPRYANSPNMRQMPSRRRSTVPQTSTIDITQHSTAPDAMTTRGHLPKSRLKPISLDPLESVGFVSKGDNKLLDHKAQKEYYDKVVERYLAFCARHDKNLDAAMDSLPVSPSFPPTRSPSSVGPSTTAKASALGQSSASTELSSFLLALRKLREAILSTSATTPPSFAQKVHIFSVRISILAQHPPSYLPSLDYLLRKMDSRSHPLPDSELREFVSYEILDHACRQCDMIRAFELRAKARQRYAFQSRTVDRVLESLLQGNWVVFWQVRNSVDSYMRTMINWAADRMRRQALKSVGSAYLNVEAGWVLEGCTGEKGWTWEKLAEVERLGWQKEDDKIIIKRPKRKPEAKPV